MNDGQDTHLHTRTHAHIDGQAVARTHTHTSSRTNTHRQVQTNSHTRTHKKSHTKAVAHERTNGPTAKRRSKNPPPHPPQQNRGWCWGDPWHAGRASAVFSHSTRPTSPLRSGRNSVINERPSGRPPRPLARDARLAGTST